MQKNWHLTEALIAFHFVGLFAVTGYGRAAYQVLAFEPRALASKPWSLFTYQFLSSSLFWFLFSMIVLWVMGRTLESDWGSPRFAVFWLVSTLGAATAAAFIGYPLAGDVFLGASLLFAFATVYPETEFRLFLLVPVKVKYLAVIGGAILVYSSLQMGLGFGLVNLAGTSAGYLFFLATRRLPSRRKIGFELSKRKAEVMTKIESSAAESRNRVWDPKVRAAEARAREQGRVGEADLPLLDELDRARDPSITVCAPSEFGYVEDDICRSCPGYAECAARRIRMAAEEAGPLEAEETGHRLRRGSR